VIRKIRPARRLLPAVQPTSLESTIVVSGVTQQPVTTLHDETETPGVDELREVADDDRSRCDSSE
jgi:hypothetical protein